MKTVNELLNELLEAKILTNVGKNILLKTIELEKQEVINEYIKQQILKYK